MPVQKVYVLTNNRLDWGHADVYLAACETDRRTYAIRVAKVADEKRYHRLKREARILRKLQGIDNVVSLLDVVEAPDELFLVFPPLEKSLFTYVACVSGRFSEAAASLLLSKLSDALIVARKRNISHLNLKLENIMLTNTDLEPVITDWSCGEEIESQQRLVVSRGAHHYMSPELVMNKPFDPEKADVWALGVIIYAVVVGRFPFEDPSRSDDPAYLFTLIRRGSFEMPATVSEALADLLNGMMEHNDRRRLTLKEVRLHRFTNPHGPPI